MRRFVMALCCAVLAGGLVLADVRAQSPSATSQSGPQQDIKLKKEEFDAFKAVETAATVDAKLVAAKSFVAKFPASAAAEAVEMNVFDAIAATNQDPKLTTYITDFAALYPGSARVETLRVKLLDQYVQAGDWAAASKVGEEVLAKSPDDVRVHFRLLEIGLEAVKRGDGSLLQSATAHGARTVELFTSDKKPAVLTDAEWADYKGRFLPKAHQTLGLLAYATQSFDAALDHLSKAAALNPRDPFNHFFLGAVEDSLYIEIAKKFNALARRDTPEAKKLLEESAKKEDLVIMHFVKVVALGEGDPNYAQLVAQARPSLEERYKHRHNNSLDGLDAMIKAAKGTP